APAGQGLVDLGNTAVFGVAEAADEGNDIESELVVGQGEVGLGLGPIRAVKAGARRVGAAADVQGQPGDGVQGGDRAVVAVIRPERVLAFRAVAGDGDQRLHAGRAGARTGAGHGE